MLSYSQGFSARNDQLNNRSDFFFLIKFFSPTPLITSYVLSILFIIIISPIEDLCFYSPNKTAARLLRWNKVPIQLNPGCAREI